MRASLVAWLAVLLAGLAPGAFAAPSPEDRLSSVFEAIEANRLDVALTRVESLIRDFPNFRLAHLVRGDLLLARTRVPTPWCRVTSPCSHSRRTASRTVCRETAKRWQSCGSGGRREPTG